VISMSLAPTLFYAGVLLIFVGIIGLVAYMLVALSRNSKNDAEEHKGGVDEDDSFEGGGVIFIGPIPIVFGSNRRIAKWMIAVAVAITILLIVETLVLLGVI